jgi:hypothetical protein
VNFRNPRRVSGTAATSDGGTACEGSAGDAIPPPYHE